MKNLLHLPIDITLENGIYTITQAIGDTADDVITIHISSDQAAQISRFLAPRKNTEQIPEGSAEGFAEFWAEYPRKDNKARAFDIWKRNQLFAHAPVIMSHLRAMKEHDQWTRDGGRFVPHAATYLGQKRFLDELSTADNSAWL